MIKPKIVWHCLHREPTHYPGWYPRSLGKEILFVLLAEENQRIKKKGGEGGTQGTEAKKLKKLG